MKGVPKFKRNILTGFYDFAITSGDFATLNLMGCQ